jgi:hypothetical protein
LILGGKIVGGKIYGGKILGGKIFGGKILGGKIYCGKNWILFFKIYFCASRLFHVFSSKTIWPTVILTDKPFCDSHLTARYLTDTVPYRRSYNGQLLYSQPVD